MDYDQKHKKLVHNKILYPGNLNLPMDSIHFELNHMHQNNIVEDHIRKLESWGLVQVSKSNRAKKRLKKV